MLNRLASLAIQQAFSKPCLVNLISKDTHLVLSIYLPLCTVNWEILVRVLFSQNFAFVKCRESKIREMVNLEITLSFTDVDKSDPNRDFFMWQICLSALFAKIKFLRKFPNLQ